MLRRTILISATLFLVTIAPASAEPPGDVGPIGRHRPTIAFESARDGNQEIYVMGAAGERQLRLTDDPSFDGYPRWSPDGQRILFHSDRSGTFQLYVMDVDGADVTALTNGASPSMWGDWSPDGNRIVFVRFDGSNPSAAEEVYTMRSDGSSIRRLTHNRFIDTQPAWSSDGLRIAITSYRPPLGHPGWKTSRIVAMGWDGAEREGLTESRSFDGAPSWHESGRCLAFASDRRGDSDIYVMDARGQREINLTRQPGYDSSPSWGVDGKIAFVRTDPGSSATNIYAMEPDGSRVTRLTDSGADGSPDQTSNVGTPMVQHLGGLLAGC